MHFCVCCNLLFVLAGQVHGENPCNDSRLEINLPRLERKKASILSCFLNIFGENFGGTVQISAGSGPLAGQVHGKNRCNDSRRELHLPRLRRKKASMPSCFFYLFCSKSGGTVPKKRTAGHIHGENRCRDSRHENYLIELGEGRVTQQAQIPV